MGNQAIPKNQTFEDELNNSISAGIYKIFPSLGQMANGKYLLEPQIEGKDSFLSSTFTLKLQGEIMTLSPALNSTFLIHQKIQGTDIDVITHLSQSDVVLWKKVEQFKQVAVLDEGKLFVGVNKKRNTLDIISLESYQTISTQVDNTCFDITNHFAILDFSLSKLFVIFNHQETLVYSYACLKENIKPICSWKKGENYLRIMYPVNSSSKIYLLDVTKPMHLGNWILDVEQQSLRELYIKNCEVIEVIFGKDKMKNHWFELIPLKQLEKNQYLCLIVGLSSSKKPSWLTHFVLLDSSLGNEKTKMVSLDFKGQLKVMISNCKMEHENILTFINAISNSRIVLTTLDLDSNTIESQVIKAYPDSKLCENIGSQNQLIQYRNGGEGNYDFKVTYLNYSIKNVHLHCLLCLHQDLDDDLLQDAIELLD